MLEGWEGWKMFEGWFVYFVPSLTSFMHMSMLACSFATLLSMASLYV